uniref:Putative ovule protein n=1 Tax=Solanum chacoense TaxID=4108 RepID=A0A0V0IRU8_SOLCH
MPQNIAAGTISQTFLMDFSISQEHQLSYASLMLLGLTWPIPKIEITCSKYHMLQNNAKRDV